MQKIEKRLELRTRIKAVDGQGTDLGGVEGYATTFDSQPDLDGDRVLAGAAGIAAFTVPMLAYHDRKQPIGSATMTPDAYGVQAKGAYANTQGCQDIRNLVLAKAIPAFSIGFWSDDYEPNEFGGVDFKSIHIYEVSLVPIPANPRALVTAAKSLGGAEAASLRDDEKQYVDIEPPAGSYEAIQEDVREALNELYSSPNSYISLISTFTDKVVYSVESYPAIPAIDGTWQVDFSYGDGGDINVSWPAAPVEIVQTVVTDDDSDDADGQSATDNLTTEKTDADDETEAVDEVKSGKRNAATDQTALDEAHDLLVKAGANCKMIDTDDDESKALRDAKQRHASARANLRLLTDAAELDALLS